MATSKCPNSTREEENHVLRVCVREFKFAAVKKPKFTHVRRNNTLLSVSFNIGFLITLCVLNLLKQLNKDKIKEDIFFCFVKHRLFAERVRIFSASDTI